ncbi:MFS transporter [Nocardia arthritidis]|uniref:MFS transporter n=1 Tax=Nocardia arthritidis TaxID=228602 RepID=A0A6G9YHM1_9NOCA|nr:MFS transporter [Nocardia arthritidis]QIS12650.1 MFS transporter [Nocardia arthritidis]
MLRNPTFRLLLGARTLSTLCTGLDLVVLAWLVIVVGGTPMTLAIMAALSAGAGVPAAFFGGPLIDRFSRRAVTVATEAGRILPVGLLPLLAAFDEVRIWQVLAVSAWVSGLYSLSAASYSALLPQLFDRTNLLRANGLWQAASQVGVFIGAALGGLAIPAVGAANSLLFGLAGRVVIVAALLALRLPHLQRPSTKRSGGFLFRDMAEAWGFLREHRLLLWTTLFVAVPGSLISGINAVLPAFVKNDNHLGATDYGLIDAAWGVGAFVASVLCVRLPNLQENHRNLAGSLLLTGGAMALLATARNLPWSLVFAGLVGGAALGSLVLFRAHVQAEAPPEHTGRILAMSQLVLSALWFGVALGLGALTLLMTVRAVIVTWGVLIVLSGLAARRLMAPRLPDRTPTNT